jgi:hypothetical protein
MFRNSSLPVTGVSSEFTAYILRREGKPEEGLRALEQAVALDPRNPFMLSQLSISYDQLRRLPRGKGSPPARPADYTGRRWRSVCPSFCRSIVAR